MGSLIARDGDVLVVMYPEVKVPIAQYWTVGVGALTYSRKLVEGDNVDAEYEKVYSFLKAKAEKDGREKLAAFSSEVAAAGAATRGLARGVTAPKPAGNTRKTVRPWPAPPKPFAAVPAGGTAGNVPPLPRRGERA